LHVPGAGWHDARRDRRPSRLPGARQPRPRAAARRGRGRRRSLAACEALERLLEGNRRFAAGLSGQGVASRSRRAELVSGQQPFAIVLGCSDSRVPAELVFDQGLGDLFVIRVAGNVVAPSQVGSVEFAAERFGTRLVVVLGHTQCGAVAATLEQLRQPASAQSPNLRSIVERIRPAVEPLCGTALGRNPEALAREAVRANIRASVRQLQRGSPLVEALVDRGMLLVVGAEYSLETGRVEVLEDVARLAEGPPSRPRARSIR
jgi:carbonic anhydrase